MDYADLNSFLHKDGVGTAEERKKVIDVLHEIWRPFWLQRVKGDIEKNLLPNIMFLF